MLWQIYEVDFSKHGQKIGVRFVDIAPWMHILGGGTLNKQPLLHVIISDSHVSNRNLE
jgi:hypothetical protein